MLPSLLSPNKLKKILTTTSSFYDKFRIIEANLGDNSENYKKAHIDRAVFLNTLECAEISELHPRNVPKPDCFKDYVGSLGIANKHHLILYDRSQFGFYTSSRMWWVFRLFGHENVSILDGGLNLWAHHNYELSTELPNFAKEKFTINLNKDIIRDFEAIQQNIASPHEQVVDCRSQQEFNSKNDQGIYNHIPGAKNVSYNDLFDKENGRIKDKQDLLRLFEENNVDLSKPMVASCLTGMTACSLAFAAHLTAKSSVPVYYGSWTEFSKKRSN